MTATTDIALELLADTHVFERVEQLLRLERRIVEELGSPLLATPLEVSPLEAALARPSEVNGALSRRKATVGEWRAEQRDALESLTVRLRLLVRQAIEAERRTR